MENPDCQASPGENGRASTNTGSKGRLGLNANKGRMGCANANTLIDAEYVASSKIPDPHGGSRELMEA